MVLILYRKGKSLPHYSHHIKTSIPSSSHALRGSNLGKALSEELNTREISLEVSTSLYPKLEKQAISQQLSVREFWLGNKRLPQTIEVAHQSGVSAILIKN